MDLLATKYNPNDFQKVPPLAPYQTPSQASAELIMNKAERGPDNKAFFRFKALSHFEIRKLSVLLL